MKDMYRMASTWKRARADSSMPRKQVRVKGNTAGIRSRRNLESLAARATHIRTHYQADKKYTQINTKACARTYIIYTVCLYSNT